MAYLRLCSDEGVDGAVVRGLRRLGWDVLRALDVRSAGTSDEIHSRTAAELDRVLVSTDQDMLAIASRWQHDGRRFPGLIFWPPDKYERVGDILRAFAAATAEAESIPLASRVKYL